MAAVESLLVVLAMALAALGVVLARALGRYAVARLAKLPIERARLRVFVRLDGPGRAGARLGARAAGTAAAYLAVAALGFAFATCRGIPTGDALVVVREAIAGSAAAGELQPGDRILAVDGAPLVPGRAPSLTARVNAKQGAAVTLTVRRAGARLDVTIQPKLSELGDRSGWLIGVRQGVAPELTTAAAAGAAYGIRFPIEQARALVTGSLAWIAGLADVITGEDAAEAGGPVRIVDEFRRAAEPVELGAWRWALPAATCALFVLAILDVFGALVLAIARARARPA